PHLFLWSPPALIPHCQTLLPPPLLSLPMAAAEEGPEPLKYQTLALKVSTHCEGCKREVKRILNMEGVYRISFGPQQHKVVVIGNVAAETLVKKLTKSGKHAELWPEPLPDENAEKKSKNKSDGMPNAPPEPEGESPKSDDKEPPPAQEKPNGTEKAAATNAGGGKKKGKKNHNANNNNNRPPQEFGKKAAGGLAIPPALNLPFYSTSQLPSYVVSYSSVHPSNNYGGAYHPAAPMQHGNFVYSTAAPGSCYIFSEENANACSVM
ncbi:unnamed protein product, partial [Musa banksii]